MRDPALLVVLLAVSVVALAQDYIIQFVPRAAPPAGQTIVSDDFDRANNESLGSNWGLENGGADYDIDTNQVKHQTGSSGTTIWINDTASATQWACVQRVDSAGSLFNGVKLRVQEDADTSDSYAARWDTSSNLLLVRTCNTASCSTIGSTHSYTFAQDHWLCAYVTGTGSSTEFALWDFSTAPDTDQTNWGTAEVCWCDGGTCSFGDCSGATIINAEPGAGNYSDCASGCFVGLYNGGAQTQDFDNFVAGWD